MYRYQRGDLCPFCGQLIPDDATPGQLYAISVAAHAIKLPEPDRPAASITCTLIANSCASGIFTDHRCCRACDKYLKCAYACQNSPERCKQGRRRGRLVEEVDTWEK